MNLMTAFALSLALVAASVAGAGKVASLLKERVAQHAAAEDALIELARRGEAPAPSDAQKAAYEAQLRQRSTDELAALIQLAR